MIDTRGLTHFKIHRVKMALDQICSDCRNPYTMTAQIMSENDVTMHDVLDVCSLADSALSEAMSGRPRVAQQQPQQPPRQPRQQPSRQPSLADSLRSAANGAL